MIPPRNAMSVPERIGAWMSASADVRVNRGSTWITVAPRDFASVTKRKATGWFSAMFEPMTVITSLFARSQRAMVAAPRPNVVPRLGTEEECQILAWFSMFTMPRPPPNSFFIR